MGCYIHITVGKMKKLGLFDNISYKYIIDIIDDHERWVNGFIDIVECDDIECCRFRFKFYIYPYNRLVKVESEKEYGVNDDIVSILSEILKRKDEELGEEEEKLLMLNIMLNQMLNEEKLLYKEKMLREEEEKKEILSVKNILRWLLC